MTARENLLRAIRRDRPAWVPNGMESVVRLHPPLAERPGAAGPDCFGVMWAHHDQAEGGTYPAEGGRVLCDAREWRSTVRFPRVDALDWSGVSRQAAAIDRSQHLVQGFVEMGLFERSYLLLGMEEALVSYLTQPEEMRSLAAAIADYKIALIDRFHAAAKPDIVWYGDDWGTQEGLFMPPVVWRAILKPETRRIYDRMRELGIIVQQHSCGRIEEVLPDMVEMGAQVWHPCQPCNDLARLKRDFGARLCFHGGIDSQFVLDRPGVSESEVRTEVRRRIAELAPGGGYIAAPSHSVHFREDVVKAMDGEIALCGRYA